MSAQITAWVTGAIVAGILVLVARGLYKVLWGGSKIATFVRADRDLKKPDLPAARLREIAHTVGIAEPTTLALVVGHPNSYPELWEWCKLYAAAWKRNDNEFMQRMRRDGPPPPPAP